MTKICGLDKNEGMRSFFLAFPLIIYLHIFVVRWVKCEYIQDDGKLCVRAYTLYYTTI